MSDYHETQLNQYLNSIDQLVAENEAREQFIDEAETLATLDKMPAAHMYAWVKWFVDESLHRDDNSTPTTKEFYELVKDESIDLFLDEGEPGPPMFEFA